MKTIVLTLAQNFHCFHPRKGEPTGFKEKFLAKEKIHTIRANYEIWYDRFRLINAGEACLSIRQWSDKPYRSRQIEIARLTKEDGIGLQRLSFSLAHPTSYTTTTNHPAIITDMANFNREIKDISPELLAKNDGLDYEDWSNWFDHYDLSHSLALIHFTPFRY